MRTARCPSCGANVEFHSSASVMAVCGYCQCTLVRTDLEIENLGRMANLAEDASPFKLGYISRWRGVGFRIIGRLQLQYAEGCWNEWFCQFDDGREGWISEGSGLAYVTFERTIKTALPPIDQFSIGAAVKLDGERYTVMNIEDASCIAVQGELPFKATPGYAAPAVDLRSDNHFASLDYSENPPRAYLGFVEDLGTLTSAAVDIGPLAPRKAAIREFKCKGCGAPLKASLPDIKSVACGACGTIVDAEDASHLILSHAAQNLRITPALEPGSVGKFRGLPFTILGFMRREIRADDIPYQWDEYLLHNEKEGFRWLTCYHGHWNLGRAAKGLPQDCPPQYGRPRVSYLGKKYSHFSSGLAKTIYVVGEFNWKVRRDETWTVDDFVAPPLMLSREQSHKELTWTISEYLSVEQLTEAFRPAKALDQPTGAAANQPSPYSGDAGRYWIIFMLMFVVALAIQAVFMAASDKRTFFSQSFELASGEQHQTMTSDLFAIGGHEGVVLAVSEADVSNRWIDLDIVLTNTQTGQRYLLQREISYYFGSDSDGNWTEGSQHDRARIAEVPPGNYVMETEMESDANHPEPIRGTISLVRNPPAWSAFWVTVLVLMVVPAYMQWRAGRFEVKRWADSDHPLISSS